MSNTSAEHAEISIHAAGAWGVLQDIFRATASEWFVNYEHVCPVTDAALSFLYDAGWIVAKPMRNAPFNFVPSDRARDVFALDYQGESREPRNADRAILMLDAE